jgi:hypothetical protein
VSQSIFRPGRPFMRWTPMLAVITITAVAATSIGGHATGHEIFGATSDALVPACLFVSVLIAFFMRPSSRISMDERDIAIRRDVTGRAHIAIGVFGIFVFVYMSSALEHHWWTPGKDDWLMLAVVGVCMQATYLSRWLIGRSANHSTTRTTNDRTAEPAVRYARPSRGQTAARKQTRTPHSTVAVGSCR